MEAAKTGILPLMWFCRLCTAGVNIFGIAIQVPFGKEMGFGGGIVALAMTGETIQQGSTLRTDTANPFAAGIQHR